MALVGLTGTMLPTATFLHPGASHKPESPSPIQAILLTPCFAKLNTRQQADPYHRKKLDRETWFSSTGNLAQALTTSDCASSISDNKVCNASRATPAAPGQARKATAAAYTGAYATGLTFTALCAPYTRAKQIQ
ncbi:Uncharacterised protein [Chlamydia trachomatis]|nr:Uncharacterised protein [Chlamydia trachomatis]